MSRPRIAVIGAGRWGINHIRNFQALGALAVVADPDPQRRAAATEIAPDAELVAGLDAILGRDDLDGVVLATPAPNHARDTLAAIASGLDVLVEKPMALTAADAERMARAADDAGRVLMVGHLLLYQPAIAWMREQISSGAIGDVLHVECRRLNLGTVRQVENVFWSFSPHDLAVIHYLLGEPKLVGAQAAGQRLLQADIEDQVYADLRFDNGSTAHVHASWIWPEKLRATTVIGRNGGFVYDEIAQTLHHEDARIDPESLATLRGPSTPAEITDAEPLRRECAHFLECIETRQQPVSHAWHGVEVVRMLEQVSEALQ